MGAPRYDRRATFERLPLRKAQDLLFEIHAALWPKLASPDTEVSGADFVDEVTGAFARAGLHPGYKDGEPGCHNLARAKPKARR